MNGGRFEEFRKLRGFPGGPDKLRRAERDPCREVGRTVLTAAQVVQIEADRSERRKLIPEMSSERVDELLRCIRPFVRSQRGVLHNFNVEGHDPVGQSFTWYRYARLGDAVDMSTLEVLQEIRTYHTTGYATLFKPSIQEVLAQIPTELLERVVGFEIDMNHKTIEHVELPGLSGHKATTILYRKPIVEKGGECA